MLDRAPTETIRLSCLVTHIDELERVRSLAGALWMAAHHLGDGERPAMTELAALIEDRIDEILRELRAGFDFQRT